MNNNIAKEVASIIKSYTPSQPEVTAIALREFWLGFAPNKGMALIKAEQREQFEAIGIPAPILKDIGNEIARAARNDVGGFVPLAQLLWDEYGREGHVVALIMLGAMELLEPEHVVPLLKDLGRSCVTWEDADRLAMDALEPVVRKDPDKWLSEIAIWLNDQNKWLRRASIIVIGRLPLRHPTYVNQCLEFTKRLLFDTDMDVKKAVSFAIRLCAKVDAAQVCAFLSKQVPASNPAAVWVLCDVIKSMDRKIIPAFSPLLPRYKEWSATPELSSRDQRSIESAIQVLQAS